jgi:hypothetical protein
MSIDIRFPDLGAAEKNVARLSCEGVKIIKKGMGAAGPFVNLKLSLIEHSRPFKLFLG